MWGVKLKATNEQRKKTNENHRHREQYGGYQKEEGMGQLRVKVDQIYNDGGRFEFG